MEGFNKCKNGHYYKKELTECPYCLSGDVSDIEKTKVNNKTEVYKQENKTMINPNKTDEVKKTEVYNPTQKKENIPTQQAEEENRTRIYRPETNVSTENPNTAIGRKMVGWLVSYTIDPLGIDFRLYEGRNTIGRKTENDIRIIQDETISKEHAVILFRDEKFYIEDLMSTGGTKVNNKSLSPREIIVLSDGDTLVMAKTVFKFKVSI